MEPIVLRAPSRLRRVLSCRVLTAWQQVSFAFAFVILGAVLVATLKLPRPYDPVVILDPVIERHETDYSVYRLRFAALGAELPPCHIVAWHQTMKWTVRCA